MTFRPQSNYVFIRNSRHGSAHAVISLDLNRIRVAPNLPPVIKRQTPDSISTVFSIVIQNVHPTVQDGRPGIALAHVKRP